MNSCFLYYLLTECQGYEITTNNQLLSYSNEFILVVPPEIFTAFPLEINCSIEIVPEFVISVFPSTSILVEYVNVPADNFNVFEENKHSGTLISPFVKSNSVDVVDNKDNEETVAVPPVIVIFSPLDTNVPISNTVDEIAIEDAVFIFNALHVNVPPFNITPSSLNPHVAIVTIPVITNVVDV